MRGGWRGRHHTLWWLSIGAASLVSTVVGLAVAAFFSLRSEWGGGLARDLALPRINQSIAGRLEVADFRFRGRSVELRGVVLRDPEGEKVAELKRALVVFSPLALLRRHVNVQRVLLEQPALALERGEQGWNLTRAIAPRRKPSAPAQPPPPRQDPSALKLDVHQLSIAGGLLQLRDEHPALAPGGLPPIQLAELESEGAVHLALGAASGGGNVDTELRLSGSTLAPIRAPFRLEVAGEAIGEVGHGRVRVDWGDNRVHLQLNSAGGRSLDLDLQSVRVEPGLIRRFVSGYPVGVPVEISGSTALRGPAVRADLGLTAARMRGRLHAQGDLERRTLQQVQLSLRQIDLASLLIGGPRSRFDLMLEGAGGGADADSAWLRAQLRVLPGAEIEGRQLGPVRARLRGQGGRYQLEELVAVLPGLRVSGQGEVDADRKLALELQVHGDDLGLAARSLGVPARAGVAGRGEVSASVRGSMKRPLLQARAHVPLLKVAGNAVDDLRLSVRSEGRQLPIEADGQLQVAALRAGGRRFGQVAAEVHSTRAGAFSLQASTATPTRLAVRAAGRARAPAPGQLAVDLGRLQVDYPRASWRQAGASHLETAPRRFSLQGLELRADPDQRLTADLRQRGQALDAHLVVAGLDLSRLPPGLVPPGRRLGGRLDAELRTRGRLPGPELDLQAHLRDGQLDRFSGVALDLSARNRQSDGIAAQLRVLHGRQPLADLQARVSASLDDLIATMNRRDLPGTPVVIDARVGPLRVQRLGLPTAASDPGGGRSVFRSEVQAQLSARGTLSAPRVNLQARAEQARLGNTPLGRAEARFTYADAQSKLDAQVQTARGGTLNLGLQARADLSLPALRRGLQVRAIPVDGELSARALDLGVLSGLNDTVRAMGGLLQAQGHVHGTVGTPQLAGRLSWKNGRLLLAGSGEYRDIDLALRGDEKEMVLERLFARSGSGTAEASGRAAREADGQRLAVEARARLRQFRFYTEGQSLGALSVDATAKGQITPQRIAMSVNLPEGHFVLAEGKRKKVQPLARPLDIVILENGQPIDAKEAKKLRAEEPSEASGAAPRVTRVTVDADRNLWVRGPDMNIELGLEPGFVFVQAAEPGLFGTVKVLRGYLQVFGRRFDLKAGSTAAFSGPPDRPRLSVDAAYTAESASTASTTVDVHIEGPADRLSFNLRSPEHPEYGDTELLSLVVTGRLPDDVGKAGGAAPGDKAASLLGGLLASRVQKALAKRLPLDVLLLEPGQELEGARLEAGTYIGNDLYVAYVGRMGVDPFLRENRNEVHLELQLGQRWSVEASYGDARRGSADLMWSKNY